MSGEVPVRGLGLVLVGLMGCGLGGCKPGGGTQATPGGETGAAAARPAVSTAAAPLDPATLGEVSGVARFAGKAPAPVKIDTTMDPACGFGGGGDVLTEQYAVKGDRLANVYVYVKSGPGKLPPPAAAGSVVLDQKGCMYVPHVIAVGLGQPVEFRNSDPTMHNIHTTPPEGGNAAIDVSQGPRGQPQVKSFNRPEVMMPVRCNNHPWMNAFINVSATPWFAVTAADGKFVLKGMPAGEYVIGAVHEKMGEQEIKVLVRARGATQADFTFAAK